mgnify:CR=1 FL=1
MLADLQKPIVPQVVQSILAAAAETAEETRPTPRGGRRNHITESDAVAHSKSGEDALWEIPALGNAKNANRVEVRNE